NKHIENNPEYKSLMVNKGIDQPSPVSTHSVSKFLRKQRRLLPVDAYVEGILESNVALLSKAVTLVESSKPDHQGIAQEIITKCLPYSGNSIRIGITGV